MRDAIAKKLIQLRGQRTRAEIARGVGVSKQAIQMYETGQRVPKDDIKVRIAKYYGVSVESIFFADKVHDSLTEHHVG